MATYVSLVNKAISESGCDLALYQADGSDFDTNTEPMLNRFKTWVARSWQTVQQVAFDWEFLNNQGIVTINPGLMFYTDGDIVGELNTELDFYGTDGSVLFEDIPVNTYKDLTYSQYSNDISKSLGYVDLTCSGDSPLEGLSFKAGGDTFFLANRDTIFTAGPSAPVQFFTQGVFPGQELSIIAIQDPFGTPSYVVAPSTGVLLTLDPLSNDATRGSDGFTFSSENTDLQDVIDSGDAFIFNFYANASDIADYIPGGTVPGPALASILSTETTLTYEPASAKAYLHSWKSFNFSEETDADDYQAEICEINPVTFHLIDHESDSPSTDKKLTYVPWDIFRQQYDKLTNLPGTPIFITEDNTGRWRLYPHPDRPITLKFDYNRIPQELVLFDDVPKGLPNDFMELVMWLAIRMYGEYDEQPSVARRAERYYKDLLQRLQIKYRPKFRFQPVRLY